MKTSIEIVNEKRASVQALDEELSGLAETINSSDSDIEKGLHTQAIAFARAKKLCKDHNRTFKDWVSKNTRRNYHYAVKLASLGEQENVQLAIEDFREGRRAKKATSNTLKKVVPGTTFTKAALVEDSTEDRQKVVLRNTTLVTDNLLHNDEDELPNRRKKYSFADDSVYVKTITEVRKEYISFLSKMTTGERDKEIDRFVKEYESISNHI